MSVNGQQNFRMSQLMVLGITDAQADPLQRLVGRFEIHAVARSNSGNGLMLVDVFQDSDIRRFEAQVRLSTDHRIDYIYALGPDVGRPRVSFVSRQLGLRHFLRIDTARNCQDRVPCQIFLGIGGKVPFSSSLEPNHNIERKSPTVVKAFDRKGRTGIRTISGASKFSPAVAEALTFSNSECVTACNNSLGREALFSGVMQTSKGAPQ